MNITSRLDESDHVFIQYFGDDYTYGDATEASFEFYLEAFGPNTRIIFVLLNYTSFTYVCYIYMYIYVYI